MTNQQLNTMHVIKRDGTRAPFDLAKWQAQIAKMCQGVADVSPSMIELAAKAQFRDGMTTRELDEIALKSMANLIDEELHPEIGNINYQYVAGKQRLAMLRKDVYGDYEVPRLYDIVKRNVELELYTHELLEWYTEAEWDAIDKAVDHAKDEELPYAAVDQLIEKYLIRNRATGVIVETPQVRYAVAAAVAFHAETRNRIKQVTDFYHAASDGLFTLATPVLAGLGTKTKQFSSCVVMRANDSLNSIFATGEVLANYAAKRAGIGLEIGRMRPLGASIRKGEIKHTGIVPFLKKWYADLRSCSAGGIRNAAATVTMPIWHYQIEDFLVLKNNKGTDETRVRHLDYSVASSAMFWRRLKAGESITLFDPNEVPDLYEAFYRDIAEFERLYAKYERRKDLRTKVVTADHLMRALNVNERQDTGRIYQFFSDNVQRQGPFEAKVHPIYQSNLCQEIFIPSATFERVDDENGLIGLCTLGSLNWGAFRHPEEMRRAVRLIHRALHNLLQYQDFLSPQSARHNKMFEPIGLGVTNLAYWHAKRKLKYGEADALAEVKRWIEHQAFYALEMSVELAAEKGPCTESANTRYGRGEFTWERRAPGVNELTDFTPCPDLDWEGLRVKMKTHGVRNATTLACPPVESSSVVINSTNGLSMPKELIIAKGSKAGAPVQVVPEYRRLKKHYQLLWDQPSCQGYLKTMAVIQAHVDQGISVDTFYSAKNFRTDDPDTDGKIDVNVVIGDIMLAQKWGIKSLYYSLTDKEAALAVARGHGDPRDDDIAHLPEEAAPAADEGEEHCEACVL
jgi:ribonucleoside-diphosphate reductase alpha chain